MEFGVGYFPTHDGMRPGEIARRAAWLPSGPWSTVEPELGKWEKAIGDLVGR
jgi:hypothetical protein